MHGSRPRLCCPPRPTSVAREPRPCSMPPARSAADLPSGSIASAPRRRCPPSPAPAVRKQGMASALSDNAQSDQGLNGFAKDAAHECRAAPQRRRVRGLAAQSHLAHGVNVVQTASTSRVRRRRAIRRRRSARPSAPRPSGGFRDELRLPPERCTRRARAAKPCSIGHENVVSQRCKMLTAGHPVLSLRLVGFLPDPWLVGGVALSLLEPRAGLRQPAEADPPTSARLIPGASLMIASSSVTSASSRPSANAT